MNVKGLLLCGGRASRLKPHSNTGPKSLLPVANRPIVDYALEKFAEAEITDIGIIISPETGQAIKDHIGSGERFGVSVTYILQDEPRGLADAVKTARGFLEDSCFVMYLGDNMLDIGLNLVKPVYSEEYSTFPGNLPYSITKLLLKKVENPKIFGVAEIDDTGKVISLEEKPQNPKSDLALVGVYGLTPQIHEAIDNIKPSARGELEITDALQWLLNEGITVMAKELDSFWLDTGKSELLLDANRQVLDVSNISPVYRTVERNTQIRGRVQLGKHVILINSIIEGPAIIGDYSVLTDSYIGPYTSIGRQVGVKDTEIENSIVMEGAYLYDVPNRISHSIIGRNSEIIANGLIPNTLKFNIGNDTRIEL